MAMISLDQVTIALQSGDQTTKICALNELNTVLSMNQGDLRVTPFVPILAGCLRSTVAGTGSPEIALQTVRAINNVIDIDPRCASMLVAEGVLPVLIGKLENLWVVSFSFSSPFVCGGGSMQLTHSPASSWHLPLCKKA